MLYFFTKRESLPEMNFYPLDVRSFCPSIKSLLGDSQGKMINSSGVVERLKVLS